MSNSAPTVTKQLPHLLMQPQLSIPRKKFTPASRCARLQSWQQRMQLLFARQLY